MEKKLQLRVAQAKKRDIGRNIVRIDNPTMEKLLIKTGDVISLFGKKESAGIAFPSYPQDSGLGIIRIDSRLRKNTGTSIDDTVEIRKVKALPAQKIVLAPSDVKIRTNPRFENFIKKRLNNFPVVFEDYIFISIGINRDLAFKVIELIPESICLIKPETRLTIGETLVKTQETLIDFNDMGGLKDQISEIEFLLGLNLYEKFESEEDELINEPLARGILFSGASGTGKTLLMKAIANQSKRYIISINAVDVMSSYQGESEKKLRKIFTEAKENSPSIIFIDQIDAIAPKINKQLIEMGRHLEYRIVSQLLGSLDGIKTRGDVIVIGATNKIELIEPALLRPGRIDKIIHFPLPNLQERIEIFTIKTRDLNCDATVSYEELANLTEKFTGAEISGVCKLAHHRVLKRKSVNSDSKTKNEKDKEILIISEDFKEAITEIAERKELS